MKKKKGEPFHVCILKNKHIEKIQKYMLKKCPSKNILLFINDKLCPIKKKKKFNQDLMFSECHSSHCVD